MLGARGGAKSWRGRAQRTILAARLAVPESQEPSAIPPSPPPVRDLRFHFARLGSPLCWSAEGPGAALLCLPAIAISLYAGIAFGQPA